MLRIINIFYKNINMCNKNNFIKFWIATSVLAVIFGFAVIGNKALGYITPTATYTSNSVTPTATYTSSNVTPTATYSSNYVTPTATYTSNNVTPTATYTSNNVTPTATYTSSYYTSDDWLSCGDVGCGSTVSYPYVTETPYYYVNTCSNECSPSGLRQCSGNGYRQCGNYDSDSCLEWSSVTACGSNQTCNNGSCITNAPVCSDECSVSGKRECSGNGYRQCGNYDSDSCLEWSPVTNCGSNETCSNGSCNFHETCSNECSVSGQRQCSGNGYQQCGNYDSDSCLEWGSVTNCGANEQCSNGSCNPVHTCSDDCSASGQRRCAGNGVQECKRGSDGCLKWDGITSCGFNETCSNGSCNSTCQNQCSSGDHQCSGNSGRTCNLNGNCTAWGNYQSCDSRCYRCGDGRCDSDCGESKSSCSQDCGSNKPKCEDVNANAGSDKDVDQDESVTLNGSVDGDYDSVRWSCTGGTLSNRTSLRPTFRANSNNNDYDNERTYTCTLTATNECGSDSDNMKVTANNNNTSNFNVSLTAQPESSCAPANGIDLSARVTNYGNNRHNYTYYFDCDNDGDWEKTVTTENTSYTATNLCDYRNVGSHTAAVKVTSNGRTATDTTSVRAEDCENHVQINGQASITKTVRNITSGTGYQGTVNANPGDTVSYRVIISGTSRASDNVMVTDAIPNGISNVRNLQINGLASVGTNPAYGISLGSLANGQTKTITYDATVASEANFSYGQTTLTNTATVTIDGASANSSAAVQVYRHAVQGATTVSTGFDSNMFAGVGVALAGAVISLGWLLGQSLKKRKLTAEDLLARKISFIKKNSLA